MKKQYLFEYRRFSAFFILNQSKDNVILDFAFTVFEKFCAILLSCQIW